MRTKQNLPLVWFSIRNIGPAVAGLLGPSHIALGAPLVVFFGGVVGGCRSARRFIKNHANSIIDSVIAAPPTSNLSTNMKTGLGHGSNNLSTTFVLCSVQGNPHTLPRHVAGVESLNGSNKYVCTSVTNNE